VRLVDDARKAWRWISVQAMAAAIAVQGTWEVIPDDLKTGIPPRVIHLVSMGLLVLGIVGRLVKQKDKP
jgi:hypothetical protein